MEGQRFAGRVVVGALEGVRMDNGHPVDTVNVREAHDASEIAGKEDQKGQGQEGMSTFLFRHVRFYTVYL